MGKFIKPGKCIVVLSGRFAGHKAVVVRNFDNGSENRKYSFAIVAGVERYPRKVLKGMEKRTVARRSVVKPFLKVVNYNHILPTRYGLDADLQGVVKAETVANMEQKKMALKKIGKMFRERYSSGKNKWFFSKLRF